MAKEFGYGQVHPDPILILDRLVMTVYNLDVEAIGYG